MTDRALVERAIETVAYQARAAVQHKPCKGSATYRECSVEFPALPSRWCSGCLIEAMLEGRTEPCPMCAAPELLAALKELENITLSVTRDHIEVPVDEWRGLLEKAAAALAKAEGA